MIKTLSQFTRYKNWWKYTAAPLLGVAYFMLFILAFYAQDSFRIIVRLLLSITGFASLGYFLNDWGDIEADEKASKQNKVSSLSRFQKILLIAVFCLLALTPWVFFRHFVYSVSLIAVELLFFITYSFPPFRLKAKLFIAPAIDALYSHVIPSLLFAGILFLINERNVDLIFVTLLIVWKLSSGVRYYLNHIALDRENDLRANHPTLATIRGSNFIYRIAVKYFLPIEFCALMALFIYTGSIIHLYAFLFAPIVLLVFFQEPLSSFTFKFTYNFNRVSLDDFYQRIFPLVSVLLLCYNDKIFLLLLFAHLFLFHDLLRRTIRLCKFLFPPVFIFFKALLWFVLYRPLSLVANYGIYYFLTLILRKSDEEARGKNYQSHRVYLEKLEREKEAQAELKRKRDYGRIAIVNIHLRKYTETFIYKMTERLPFETHYLFGGEMPKFFGGGIPLLTNNKTLLNWLNFLQTVLKEPRDYFLKKAVIRYLVKNKIQLILAEYGPVGVRMMEVSRETGIPFVVNFHGYDVYHKKIRKDLDEAYQQLFKECSAMIAVSKEMKQELISLGAEDEKIIYQPAFVDLELFQYHDVSKNPPVFLSVGRFAETKSPHLTILAFEKVVKKIPTAKLVMIGKDGGGELFEACKILVRSLQLETQIEFKEIVSPEEVGSEMKKVRVFVQHSITTPINHDKEGTPIAIIEAQAAGLPVVATRHAGIKDVVLENETGFLVDEFDIEAMANVMIQLANDDALVFKMGKTASEKIHTNLLFNNYIENLSVVLKGSMCD